MQKTNESRRRCCIRSKVQLKSWTRSTRNVARHCNDRPRDEYMTVMIQPSREPQPPTQIQYRTWRGRPVDPEGRARLASNKRKWHAYIIRWKKGPHSRNQSVIDGNALQHIHLWDYYRLSPIRMKLGHNDILSHHRPLFCSIDDIGILDQIDICFRAQPRTTVFFVHA